MNLVAILVAPFVIRGYGWEVRGTVIGVALALLAFAIWFSKRGGIASEDTAPDIIGSDLG